MNIFLKMINLPGNQINLKKPWHESLPIIIWSRQKKLTLKKYINHINEYLHTHT